MRILIVALIALVVVAATSLPAAAQDTNFQSTLQLRYWGAGLGFGNPAPVSATDSASTWGGTVRFDGRTTPWSFTIRYDSMSVTPSTWPWNRSTFWDANVHYRFGPSLNQYLGVFAGYGQISLDSSDPTQAGNTSGLRVGAEFFTRQPSGVYFVGDIAYGPSWSNSGFSCCVLASSNVWDGRVAVGYEFQGGWGVEGGWRYVRWTIPTSGGCPATTGCEYVFSGVTAALTFRR